MNESERSELERLKQRHTRLEQELTLLSSQLQSLEARMLDAQAGEIAPLAAPPIEPVAAPPRATAKPPPIPPIILPKHISSEAVFRQKATETKAEPTPAESVPVAERLPNVEPTPRPAFKPAEAVEKTSFEMRLGTYWLVRIGVVLVLTGLVFFGNLAYQKFGAGGKLAMLYLASGVLLGAGAWWQRKSLKESLKNYAQVLFAGGLAAVYFTTYAAHHVVALKVIESALLDGLLLLGWAGFMAWLADRKKSELLALVAVGLAYYSSVITPVGEFTLYSNLVLTIAAVFFLLRNRWVGLSRASLVATYAGYAYWRFYNPSEGWGWATPDRALWFGASFLWGYWLIFTLAVFLSKHEKMAGERRAAFLTFNNGAMFTLFVLTMLKLDTGRFWQFSLGYGVVLLGLAELSRRFLPNEPITKNTYLTQGLVLVTLGIVSHYSGLQLALVLAAESVILFILGTLRKNIFLQTGAYISGAMAVGWGIDGVERNDVRGLWLGTTLGALMALNACWAHWRLLWADRREVRPVPAYFTLLALLIWSVTTWANTQAENFPLALAVETVVLTASVYVLRVREFALLGQGLLVLAQMVWLTRFLGPAASPPWWNPLSLIAVTLALSHWWQRQKTLECAQALKIGCQVVYSLALVALTCVWLEPHNSVSNWIALTSLLAVGVTAYAVLTRAWALAICGQIFLIVSGMRLLAAAASHKPEWQFPLAPIAALGLLSFATWQWFARRPESQPGVRTPLLQAAMGYRWLALLMSVWWVSEYIPERERIWVYALLGVMVFAFAGWRRSQEALLFGAVFVLAGLTTLWLTLDREKLVYLPNFIAVIALLGQQQFARRLHNRYAMPNEVHNAMIIIGGLTVWRLVSDWVLLSVSGPYLTASWSLLAFALFGCGVILREKMYRWLGLGILAAALGRVLIFDVWAMERNYRILSLMALGVVLILLGFIYIKYEERIRRWL